jgi:hypothetical protein
MLAPLLLGLTLVGQPTQLDFYAHGPYLAGVPRPESILGYGPGERQTVFRDQERVILTIAAASPDRVRVFEYGKSVQGRPLRVLAISSPDNMRRLEEIRKDARALAEGTADEAARKRTPVIVWVNQTIHGNEPASFESAMWLLYTLAASRNREIQNKLGNAVVILNPVYNPDGHERFAVWSNSVAVGSPRAESYEQREPSFLNGRSNHYRFDMNRDRVSMSQDETRQEVAEFLRWNPHVYVDQHGQTSAYFFPPNPMSVNQNVDRARLNEWADVFGRATGRVFDRKGWTYFIGDTFDLYYPGYLDSWTSLTGAIGMTHETDGGKQLAKEREDGTVITLRDGVEKHFVSALAVIGAAVEHRQRLVDSYATFKRRVSSGEAAGGFQRVVVDGRPSQLRRFADGLRLHGIRFGFLAEPLRQKATDYWTGESTEREFPRGALVVDMAQPQGAVAKALLEPQTPFEPEFVDEQLKRHQRMQGPERYPRPERPQFYDQTGWSLPFAHNLDAWWMPDAPEVRVTADVPAPDGGRLAPSPVGWALPYEDRDDILAIYHLLAAGVRVQVGSREMRLAGRTFPRGTFLLMRHRNDDRLEDRLKATPSPGRFVPLLTSYPDLPPRGPGIDALSLRKPEIAVVFGEGASTTAFGSLWYLLEREFKIPFTPISTGALNSAAISKYTCIVFPSGFSAPVNDRLRTWVSDGGTVVAFGGDWANREFAKLEPGKLERPPSSVPGTIFRAELDTRFPLSFGYPGSGEGKTRIAVPVDGSSFLQAKGEGGGVVTFSRDENLVKLLSGWTWPDTEEALRGVVWLHDQPVGSGRVVLFMQDPADRALWPGLHGLLLNAMLF